MVEVAVHLLAPPSPSLAPCFEPGEGCRRGGVAAVAAMCPFYILYLF